MVDESSYEVAPGPLKVERIKALHGASYFSAGPVVIVRLDLGEYDEVFTSDIPGFPEKLKGLLPSLREHHCSPGHPGGFFERVQEGTLLGHVTEHVAIELQTLAGMDAGYGKTRATASPGVYNVVFRFLDEHVGLFVARAAVNAVNALLTDRPFDVRAVVDALVHIREVRLLGPSTQAIVDEAGRRGIPHQRLDEHNLVQLGTGKHQKRIRATVTSETSLLAVETAGNKYLAVRMLEDAGIPVPRTIVTTDAEEVVALSRELRGPVVVKPCQGKLGVGVTRGLEEPDAIRRAIDEALRHHEDVVAQAHVPGASYRLLVIDHRLVAAAEVEPPAVVGDGVRSIARLVDRLNAEPDRDVGDKSPRTVVEIDDETLRLLAARGYGPDTILVEGERIELKVSASLSLGGSSRDVTDLVHPANRMLAERASRAIGLDVAGVDVLTTDIGASALETGGVVRGVSAAPDFRMHLTPTEGEGRNVAAPFLDMLFPDQRETRVPLVSVTGTEGSTLAVKLIAHGLRAAHRAIGLACAEGLFVDGEPLIERDMARFEAAAITLVDVSIDGAVLEVPVRSILDRGLGYSFADVGVVLNVRETDEVYDETRGLEDVAYAKSVVVEQVVDGGRAVLNADDALVLEMRERLDVDAVLFARDVANPEVLVHVQGGGMAVALDGRCVVVLDGARRIELADLDDVPWVDHGPVEEATDVLLGGAAALYAAGVSVDTIGESLRSFEPGPPRPSPERGPARRDS